MAQGPQNFSDWVRYVFDRPVSDPQWYFNEKNLWKPSRDLAVNYLATLFERSG